MAARKVMAAWIALATIMSLLLMGSAKTLGVLGAGNPVVNLPWNTRDVIVFPPEHPVNHALSVALSGKHQYPLISYESIHPDNYLSAIQFMRPAVFDAPGGCEGDASGWICESWQAGFNPSSLSSMRTYNFIDTFKVSWAFYADNTDSVMLYTQEFKHSLERVGNPYAFPQTVVDLDFFPEGVSNWELLGAPELEFDEFGNPHLAFVIGKGPRAVVYAHRINTTPTSPCSGEAGNHYQCEIVYQTPDGSEGITDARLTLNANNSPRILYHHWTAADLHSVRYAYPTSEFLQPNCGPGGNTWRCITIENSGSGNTIFEHFRENLLDLAARPTGTHADIIYRSVASGQTRIRYARYVGAGGNCGEDYLFMQGLDERWQCESISWLDAAEPLYEYFTLGVDSMDFPVIAANHAVGDVFHAQVLYPAERVGGASGWIWEDVDGRNANSGQMIAMDLGVYDAAALVFLEDREYEPTLRLAQLNVAKIFLPQVKR